jgi:hypothetical protein
MRLEAAVALNKPAAAPAQMQGPEQDPMANMPKAGQPTNAAPKLTPVNTKMHNQLTNSGYKWTANYEPKSGQGRFGYYQHPVSGHQIVVDQMGSMQEQQQPAAPRGGGGGAKPVGGGMKFSAGKCPKCSRKLNAKGICACGWMSKKKASVVAGGPGSGRRPGGGSFTPANAETHKVFTQNGFRPDKSSTSTTSRYYHSDGRSASSDASGKWSVARGGTVGGFKSGTGGAALNSHLNSGLHDTETESNYDWQDYHGRPAYSTPKGK